MALGIAWSFSESFASVAFPVRKPLLVCCANCPPNQIKDQLADKQIIYRQLIRLLSGKDLTAGEEGRVSTAVSSTPTCYQSCLVGSWLLNVQDDRELTGSCQML